MFGKGYSNEIKAAVLAALLAGQSISQVATEYNIPEGTIKSWKSRLQPNATQATPKKEIGDLLLEYLRVNLDTLRIQAETFQDSDWLKKQSAADVAVLHGVMTDKAIRLLEALSKANV